MGLTNLIKNTQGLAGAVPRTGRGKYSTRKGWSVEKQIGRAIRHRAATLMGSLGSKERKKKKENQVSRGDDDDRDFSKTRPKFNARKEVATHSEEKIAQR